VEQVDVDGTSLPADLQPKSVGLVLSLAGNFGTMSAFVKRTEWTLATFGFFHDDRIINIIMLYCCCCSYLQKVFSACSDGVQKCAAAIWICRCQQYGNSLHGN